MADGRNLLVPFLLITKLFFLWGFAHSILDVLNKHFQDALGINKTKSALVQAGVYSGYFLMALPAGEIIRRFGYRVGVLTGLLLYGCGALLFIPGGEIKSLTPWKNQRATLLSAANWKISSCISTAFSSLES